MYSYSTDLSSSKTNDLRVVFTTVPLKIGRICFYRYEKVLKNWITIIEFKRKNYSVEVRFYPRFAFPHHPIFGPKYFAKCVSEIFLSCIKTNRVNSYYGLSKNQNWH